MAEKSSPDGKNLVWFGEIERKLAKLPMPTFTYVFPFNYFMPSGMLEAIERKKEKP
jgi:hypothetical protein